MNEPTVRVMSNDRLAMERIHLIGLLPLAARREALAEWQREQALDRTWRIQDATASTPYNSHITGPLLCRCCVGERP